ncbi:hypothetical protein BDQ12DRAFT_243718 [Crucibulum laeve]|uniref:BTB domain-containing protein n=1 Tax=Crucibulum laeve TaxID=68775 RepID=A0A5C3M5X6_9AGAR|nr:hypothetical protein BDQ12DRAFT_243718 [Crucibulum laeve]
MDSTPFSLSACGVNRHHWYPNGDLIIVNTLPGSTYQLFRIHKSLLMRYSPVFARNLHAAKEIRNGILVHRVEEQPRSIDALFRCLYQPSVKPFKDTDIVAYEELLDLCIKYQILSVVKRIVTHFHAYYPATLRQWDWNEAKLIYASSQCGFDLEEYFPEPIAMIQLARKHHIHSLLPIAFYYLSTINPNCEYADRTIRSGRNSVESQAHLRAGRCSARWRDLQPDDCSRLLHGKNTIACHVLNDFLVVPTCEDRHCFHERSQLHKSIIEEAIMDRDVLLALKRGLYNLSPAGTFQGVCVNCRHTLGVSIEKRREGLWLDLPALFGLLECRSAWSRLVVNTGHGSVSGQASN